MNGLERLTYAENEEGYVYLTQPGSLLKPGFHRFETTIPSVMDSIFKKLAAQTKQENEQLTYDLYLRRKHLIDQWRSDIRARMGSADCSAAERDVLVAALAACDRREEKLNRNSIYGVSAMEKSEANPKAPGENRVYSQVPTETIQ
jgi:hypothetical protein